VRRGVYRIVVGKPEGKKPLGRPRLGWEDNIMMDLQEVEYGGMDWIELAQNRDRCKALVNATNFVVKSVSIKHYENVFIIGLVIQHEYCVFPGQRYIATCGLPDFLYFSTLPHKGQEFRGKRSH
jgi:hypothetical protein